MIIILVLMAISLAACAETQKIPYEGVPGGRGQGFRLQPYKCSVNQAESNPEKISGQIAKISLETFEWNMEPGLTMEVNTLNQGLVHVHLGPVWYLERHESDLKPGDQVSIRALSYNVEGKVRLVATEISHKDHVVQLLPYW
jgi:hypothetical protein